jgi:hypothetical protein
VRIREGIQIVHRVPRRNARGILTGEREFVYGRCGAAVSKRSLFRFPYAFCSCQSQSGVPTIKSSFS